jgi:hypothetical protein
VTVFFWQLKKNRTNPKRKMTNNFPQSLSELEQTPLTKEILRYIYGSFPSDTFLGNLSIYASDKTLEHLANELNRYEHIFITFKSFYENGIMNGAFVYKILEPLEPLEPLEVIKN